MTWDDWFDGRYHADPNSGCWLWHGRLNDDGYGRFHRTAYKGTAHRKSYEVASGPIPPGFVVMHKCDTPACINPAHLRAGTQQDNVADRVSKRRCSGGKWKAKITMADARRIRDLASLGVKSATLQAEYGLSGGTVYAILKNRSWKERA